MTIGYKMLLNNTNKKTPIKNILANFVYAIFTIIALAGLALVMFVLSPIILVYIGMVWVEDNRTKCEEYK